MTTAFDADGLARLAARIDAWLDELCAAYAHIVAVDAVGGEPIRWLVRMHGEEKDVTTVWLTLGQRTLQYETFVMPAPEDNPGELYEHLLRRNDRLVGAHFSIGHEDAIFLRGELATEWVDHDALDRVLGTLYATVEQCFRALLRIGFARRFA
jgi:hypothetical protein